MKTGYYFAYGSNLNSQDWKRWCVNKGWATDLLRFHSIGYLPDHELAFTRYSISRRGRVLDVVPRLGHVVPGVIFEVTEEGWTALDRKENAPTSYERAPMVAIDNRGNELRIATYQVPAKEKQSFMAPNQGYLRVVLDGYEEHGFPDHILRAAAEHSPVPPLTDAFFVYGTLMRRESRFGALQHFGISCTLLAQTFGQLIDLGEYPGLNNTATEKSLVCGDYVRVNDVASAIEVLDLIEGFRGFGSTDSLFRRTLLSVDVGDGRIRLAWAYCYARNDSLAPPISCGDWREYRDCRAAFLTALVRCKVGVDELRVATTIAGYLPFSFNPNREQAARRLMPLHESLDAGTISERLLSQATGNWVTVP